MPSKVIHCYVNNKPWITSNLKTLLNEKKRAFRMGDRNKIRDIQRKLKVEMQEGKNAYGRN